MRFSSLCMVALPLLAAAQQQVPFLEKLKGYADQAQAYLAKGKSSETFGTVGTGEVTQLTFDNYLDTLRHSGADKPYNPPEAWMVYIRSSHVAPTSRCNVSDVAWNQSVPYLLKDSGAPKLATIDCEKDELLCGALAANIPSIWFFLIPKPLPDQSPAKTDIVIYNLNVTSVTDADITKIHTRKTYLALPKYEGAFHPFDGWIAKMGLTQPMAYFLFYLSKIPSWAFMVGVSLFTRWFANKRMPRPAPQAAPAAR